MCVCVSCVLSTATFLQNTFKLNKPKKLINEFSDMADLKTILLLVLLYFIHFIIINKQTPSQVLYYYSFFHSRNSLHLLHSLQLLTPALSSFKILFQLNSCRINCKVRTASFNQVSAMHFLHSGFCKIFQYSITPALSKENTQKKKNTQNLDKITFKD